jgi:GntR family transcriptional regulator, trigonelline degradation regulator
MIREPTANLLATPAASPVPWRIAAPLRQQVVTLIRDAIVAGEFRPGERLVERVLCFRYQVSRTVVREALRQLESEGLVTVEPNRGPVVTTLSESDIADLYEAREAIESAIARLFARRATEEQRLELEIGLRGIEQAVATNDVRAQVVAKDSYYDTLLAGAANETLRRLLDTIHTRTSRTRGLSLGTEGRGQVMLSEMRALTIAAVSGDGDGAARASAIHVRSAAAAALAAVSAASLGAPREEEDGSDG